MGWRGAVRALNAEIRRNERAAAREAREAERRWHEAVKSAARDQEALEVRVFEARLGLLTSLHRECGDAVDWASMRKRLDPDQPTATHAEPPQPPEPVDRSRSQAAREALAAYRPSWWEALLRSTRRRETLEQDVLDLAQLEDDMEERARTEHAQRVAGYESALAQGAAALDAWRAACADAGELRTLGERVLAQDVEAYLEVLKGLDCLRELASVLGDKTISFTLNEERATVTLVAHPDAIAPTEILTLTQRGISRKKMPVGRRMEIYQDYVCGAALRVARELLAALPILGVLVHVHGHVLNTATGHFEPCVILSVYCPREAIVGANWERVDASDLVGTLLHRMKAKRGAGFVGVEPLEMPA